MFVVQFLGASPANLNGMRRQSKRKKRIFHFNHLHVLPPATGYWGKKKEREKKQEKNAENTTTKVSDSPGKKSPSKSMGSGLLSGKDCPICMCELTDITSTNCGHIFCEVLVDFDMLNLSKSCILQAIEHQGTCPICRKKLTKRGIHPLFV